MLVDIFAVSNSCTVGLYIYQIKSNQIKSKHISIAPYVASESEAHDDGN